MPISEVWDEAIAQPWLLIGPVILTVCIIGVIYLACKRVIDDSAWITPPNRSRLVAQSSYVQFKQETPTSSLMLSRTDYVNLHQWRFLPSFVTKPFSKEGMAAPSVSRYLFIYNLPFESSDRKFYSNCDGRMGRFTSGRSSFLYYS